LPRQEGVAPQEGRPPGGYLEGATVVHAPDGERRPGSGAPARGQRVTLAGELVISGLVPRAAALKFSQRLSCDPPVLEQHQDKCGACDVAYFPRACGDVLERLPPLGEQCKAPFSQAPR